MPIFNAISIAFLIMSLLSVLSSTRTLNILLCFFLSLMTLGMLAFQLNIAIGVIFILIYISAIAVVLVSVVLVLGANVIGSDFYYVLLISILPFILFYNLLNDNAQIYVFPQSYSSSGLSFLAFDLLVNKYWSTILLACYLFSVGLFVTGTFFKSLFYKSSNSLRTQVLDNFFSLYTFK